MLLYCLSIDDGMAAGANGRAADGTHEVMEPVFLPVKAKSRPKTRTPCCVFTTRAAAPATELPIAAGAVTIDDIGPNGVCLTGSFWIERLIGAPARPNVVRDVFFFEACLFFVFFWTTIVVVLKYCLDSN